MFRTVSRISAGLLLLVAAATASAQTVVELQVLGQSQAVPGTVTIIQPSPGPTLTCAPDCTTTVPPGPNDVFTFTANPGPGYVFLDWFDGTSFSNNPTLTLQVDPQGSPLPSTVTASFAGILSLTVSGSGSGTVDSIDYFDPISCSIGQTCTSDLGDAGATVTFQANPGPDTEFVSWGGNCIANPAPNQCTVDSFNLPAQIAASFQLQVFDSDNDGVEDNDDFCPNTPIGESVDARGCSASQLDDDNDGVSNAIDQCPNTPAGESVNADGCSATQLDDDSDGVNNAVDQCPDTPAGETVDALGCSASQTDSDSDGVNDAIDQCPNTPAGEAVDAEGCSDSQKDGDSDGVSDAIDECPNTPPGESVDAVGCGDSQKDGDSDGVANDVDQCPNTPAGETVDAEGCGESQKDGDSDGVANDVDQCPNTPAGESVDAEGCGDSQKDGDSDGVSDAVDQCPSTPEGLAVNAVGCADAELDSDNDGVSDDVDECPDTPPGASVDSVGCATSQLDSDGDGVTDDIDECPDTPSGVDVVASGCTAVEDEINDFGDDLVTLQGLDISKASVAAVIDDLCPKLIAADALGTLTPEQQALREECSNLKNKNSTDEQQLAALEAITPEDIETRTDLALEIGRTQVRLTQTRVNRLRSGQGGGLSFADLTVNLMGTAVPVGMLEQAASDSDGGEPPAFSDFGNWGFFVQGDIEMGERDEEPESTAYEFDHWLLSAGGDYRFGNNAYLGASLNLGSSTSDTRLSRTEGDVWGGSLYGGIELGENGFLDAVVGYLSQTYDIRRDLEYTDSAGTFRASHLADTDASQLSVGVNAGYMFSWEGLRFGPTASVYYIDGTIDGYAERIAPGDSGAWLMEVGDNDYGSTTLALGVQGDYALLTSWGVLMPGFRFTVNSEDERVDSQQPLRFVNDPFDDGSNVVLQRRARESEYWEGAVNLAGQFSYGFSGYMSYRLMGGRGTYSQSGYTIGLRWDQVF